MAVNSEELNVHELNWLVAVDPELHGIVEATVTFSPSLLDAMVVKTTGTPQFRFYNRTEFGGFSFKAPHVHANFPSHRMASAYVDSIVEVQVKLASNIDFGYNNGVIEATAKMMLHANQNVGAKSSLYERVASVKFAPNVAYGAWLDIDAVSDVKHDKSMLMFDCAPRLVFHNTEKDCSDVCPVFP